MSEMIPVNSLLRHVSPMSERLAAASERVIRSGYFVLGSHLRQFEEAFAAYCGAAHCIGVANGTDALEVALKALGVEQGDHVAVVANAAMYATTAALACGATPVFVDIDPSTHTMSPAALEAAIARTPLKAVVATHLYGRLADMDALVPLCRSHGIAIMEDCAQSHGADNAAGARAGTLGDIASFSFYPTKNLGALGDGGAIVTSDTTLAERCRQLRQYGWSGKYVNALPGGRNSRLDELQAAFLSEMLPELDRWNERRREIANHYSARIRSPRIAVPAMGGREYVAHLYVVQSAERDAVRAALAGQGVGTEVHYPTPDYRQPCMQGRVDATPLPASEHAAATVFTLPCFPEMTAAEVDRVVAACNAA